MLIHFQKLIIVDLDSVSNEPTFMKLLSYMKTQNVSKYPIQFKNAVSCVLEDLVMIDVANQDMRLLASVLLLLAFFKQEYVQMVIRQNKEAATATLN